MKLPVLFALLFLMNLAAAAAAGPRDGQWRQVQEAMDKGLPRTALELLGPIVEASLADRAWAEATKAIGRRIAIESGLEGRASGAAIPRLVRELGQVPPPIRPVFHTLVAHAYWSYFRQNQWRFAGRTATRTTPGPDFTTWDLRRLFDEIDRHFSAALSDEASLGAIPITDFQALLEPGTVPDRLRPTLYDFLAHEALEFYQAGEQGLARPEDAFVAGSDTPILGTLDAFLRWQPSDRPTDSPSPTIKAVGLFQRLLRFHAADTDRSAWLNADIDRIVFGHRAAVGPDKDERFVSALLDVADRWPEHELSARARQLAARNLQTQGRLSEAHRLARQAASSHPDSFWSRDSRNSITEIEAPSLSLQTEYVWNPPWPGIDVEYRNLGKVWFRAVKIDWAQFLDRRFPRPERLNRRQRLEFLARPPALEWSAELPPTRDFRQRRHTVPSPPQLPPGYYLLFASHQPGFPDTANELAVATAWVSGLALLVRSAEQAIEGFVVDAATGEPLPGARVEAWFLAPNGSRSAVPAQTTDAQGLFRLVQTSRDRGHLIRATLGDQQIALASDHWWHPPAADETEPSDESLVLTDRAIYRPGQTVRFKGIAVRTDPGRVRYQLRPGVDLVVVFRDVNSQEIARRTVRTTDLGSFSGSFVAPADRLTGSMSIAVEGENQGAVTFQVEEYKRPRFLVRLDSPTEAPRLNEATEIPVRASTYTGDPIDRAKVAWSVTRRSMLPLDWGLFRPGPNLSGDDEIAHGVGETSADGSFRFRFRALADPTVLESDNPSFAFHVRVDVTDLAGETHSTDRTLTIGYSALAATLSAGSWQEAGKPVDIEIATRTLDGVPVPATGTVKVHRLEEPSIIHRPRLGQGNGPRWGRRTTASVELPEADLSKPETWKLAAAVAELPFQTTTNGTATRRFELPPGIYRAVLETRDRYGKEVTARLPIHVLDPARDRLGVRVAHVFEVQKAQLEPGQELVGLWGTGYESGRALVEVRHRGSLLERYWTAPGRTQQSFRIPVTEALRGGFDVSVSQVRENRLFPSTRSIEVPWKNKELEVRWESFRPKLEPGSKENWTIVVKPVRAEPAGAESVTATATEMAATLYDASLDQFLEHAWPTSFGFWPRFANRSSPFVFSNQPMSFDIFQALDRKRPEDTRVRHRAFPADLQFGGGGLLRGARLALEGAPGGAQPAIAATAAMPMALADANIAPESLGTANAPEAAPGRSTPTDRRASDDSTRVLPRRNLSETAFFFPHLATDSNGTIRLGFTMPEALSEWRFLGFAHDSHLRSGLLTGRTVTAKEVMVQPNPPRFLREGDELEFTAKIVNATDTPQAGNARFQLAFLADGSSADASLGLRDPEVPFRIPPRESRVVAWRLRVPDGCGFLSFRVLAATGRHSDGEEGFLPVLPRRTLVTESLPLPIRGPAKRSFDFASLRKSGGSPSLLHHSLRIEMASNPAWYAVMALPYLMESPHECSEQVFNRVYANSLARHVIRSNPRIRQVFESWRGTATLDSPLEKNAELKAVALAETPWVNEARSESESRKNLAAYFDENRLESEIARALLKLGELQTAEQVWPWFPGGPRSEFISLYIVSGFGRLRKLGVDLPLDLPRLALPRIDAWMEERYQNIRNRKELDRNHLDASVGLYLYARGFFLADPPMSPSARESCAFWYGQARDHWRTAGRQTQAHLAIGLPRYGNFLPPDAIPVADAIAKSLEEHSLVSEETGRYWRTDDPGLSWDRAPIETQALMIEMFLAGSRPNPVAAEECRVWLLKQKQTRNWKSTKATADAVHAILSGNHDVLGEAALVQVDLDGIDVTPPALAPTAPQGTRPEPGTGYFEIHVPVSAIRPDMAMITLQKPTPGVAWGAMHWQYFEDVSRIQPFAGTPLQISKKLHTRVRSRRGPELRPVTGPLSAGDELVVRLELRADRDLEYIHLEDSRGSGTEPIRVLSGYRFQDGLGYYESTRDTATHFFIEYLPRGSHVFEYPVRVQHKGSYVSGPAKIQCLYAPEYNSHSQSTRIDVQ